VIARIRSYPEDDIRTWMADGTLDWLRDDAQLTAYLDQGLRHHGQLGAEHERCVERGIELMIAWVDYRSAVSGSTVESPVTPQLISVRLPGFHHRQIATKRTGFGVHVIGSGALVEPALQQQDVLMTIANFGGGDNGRSGQCMFVAETLRREINRVGDPTVGGLYQLLHLSPKGMAKSVSYFYWTRVEPGYGTYVAMRRDHGRWVQEHRPSGTSIPVRSPFELEQPPSGEADRLFEPHAELTRDSPGVIKETNPVMLYTEYRSADLPQPIVESWGPEPPAAEE
jgi:hypothetical protein